MLCSSSCMEEEDLGAWLGLGIGSGCGLRGSHGERWPSLQFPNNQEDETMRGRDHKKAAVNNTTDQKGGRGKRLKAAIAIDDNQDDADANGCMRKKLRLTKEQSALLEDTFRSHNILSHAEKHHLARRVNLTPRQVEVWFQNRRARTKLKQTEVDCELLKRCCKSLSDENQRLKRELVELQRSAAAARRHHVQFPRAADASGTTSICPSCAKVTVTSGGETSKRSSHSS